MMFYLGMRGKWKSENVVEDEAVVTAYPLLPYKMVPANTVWEILERLGGGWFDYSKTELRRMTGDKSVSPDTIIYEEMMIDEYLIIMEMELRPGSTNVETAFLRGQVPRPKRMIMLNDHDAESGDVQK